MSQYDPSHPSHVMPEHIPSHSDYRETDSTWAKLNANAAIVIVSVQIEEMLVEKFDSELQAMKYVLNEVSNAMMLHSPFTYPPQALLERLYKRSSDIYSERAIAGVAMVYFELATWESISRIFAMLKNNDVAKLELLDIPPRLQIQ
jgi:hypothetical protein